MRVGLRSQPLFLSVCLLLGLATALDTEPLQSCAATFQAVKSCLPAAPSFVPASSSANDTMQCLQGAMEQHGGFDGCLEGTWGLVRDCAREGVRMGACLQRHDVSEHLIPATMGFARPDGGLGARDKNSTSACGQALEAASQSLKGAEAVLASGRVALVFTVLSKLFQQLNETGVPPSYLIGGHVQSFGDVDACKAIGGFQYCWMQLDFLPSVRAGVCLPQECSLEDMANVTNVLLQAVGEAKGLRHGYSTAGNDTDVPVIDFAHVQGQCGDYQFPATAGTWIMLTVTLVLVGLVLLGTWLDYRERRAREEEAEGLDEDGKAHDDYTRLDQDEESMLDEDVGKTGKRDWGQGRDGRKSEQKDAWMDQEVEKARLLEGGHSSKGSRGHNQPEDPPLSRRLLSCFSLYRTWPSLVGPAREGPFNALDGVRVFSMSWVVLGHLFVFPVELTSYTNEDAILPPEGLLTTYAGQAIISAEFSVDTFFCIGAFVAAYALTKHLQIALAPASLPAPSAPAANYKSENGLSTQPSSQRHPKKKALGWTWVPMLYLHRFLRLSPLYFYILAMYLHVQKVVNSGPFWGLLQQDYDQCAQYWWTNVLYINTLVPWNGVMGCYAVSWYMSVDFILFLLLPFLVLLYVKNKALGYLLPAVLWTASVIYAYYLNLANGASQFTFGTSITEMSSYQRDYYFRAWTRAPVYLIGVLCAFFWLDHTAAVHHAKDKKKSVGISSHWLVRVFAHNRKHRLSLPIAGMFFVSFVLLALTCYGAQPAYHKPLAPFWDSSYLALSRSAWCIGLMLLCFLLFQGYGGVIKGLLENRVCAVLGRLTFGSYLVHPALIFLIYGDAVVPIHYSVIWVSFSFLGLLTTVFLFAAVGYLLVEKPFANLERMLFAGKAQSKKAA